MNQPEYFLATKRVLIFIFVLLVVACKQNNEQSSSTSTIENDSIFILINQGRDKTFQIEKRALLLNEAYKKASNSKNDSLKPRYYSLLSLAYLSLEDSLLFRKTNRLSIVQAKKVNDSITHAEAHWDLGKFYIDNIMPDSAYYNYREAHLLYDTMGDDIYSGRMLYNMASMQVKVKDYTGAEINAFKAIGLFKPLNENRRLYNCYNLLGSISKELNEYERSLEYFSTAEDYLREIEDMDIISISNGQLQNNIGNVFKEQNLFKQAIPYYEKALLTDSLKTKRPLSYAKYLDNYAICRLYSGDTIGVKEQLMEALKIRKEKNDVEVLATSHHSLAEYYLKDKDLDKALLNAQLAKQYALQSSNNGRLLETLKLLTLIDKPNVDEHTSDYISLTDKLIQEERQARDKFTRISFETNEVNAENEALLRKQLIWIGIAIAVFLMGIAVYVIINQRVKNQALRFQQQQQASNQEIFDLMLSQKQKIEDSKKKEQKRISEELHDGVLGKMLGARMVLTGLNKRTNEEAVEERAIAISALKDVEGEVRAISHELSHAAYQNINNFINSIQELLTNVSNANSLEHTFDYDETYDWDSMSGDIKINLYRIVQESLQNAVKHAQCKNILVNFVRSNGDLNVTITDDGKGFKTTTGKKGIGMRNIESRVNKLKGIWDIASTVGKGTTISAKIPLNKKQALEREATNLQVN